jgi:hypothetical protein
MAHNSLSPAFVKLYYNFNNITHVQTIPVIPSGTPTVGSLPNVTPITGSPITFAQFMTDYMVVFRPFFHNLTTIQSAEFWYQSTPTADPIWIYDHPINLTGSSGSVNTSMGQIVLTMRTALGGIYRWYAMEPSSALPLNVRTPGAALATTVLALSNYLKGSTSCVYGRDNASLQVPIFSTTKINDALRKRRLLF